MLNEKLTLKKIEEIAATPPHTSKKPINELFERFIETAFDAPLFHQKKPIKKINEMPFKSGAIFMYYLMMGIAEKVEAGEIDAVEMDSFTENLLNEIDMITGEKYRRRNG